MKTYFEDLKVKFYNALEDIKNDDNQKVFMVGCRDAGNYDYLFIVGSIMQGQYKFIHIDYERLITFDDQEIVNAWFKGADEGFPQESIEHGDMFEAEWTTMEFLKEHMSYFVEHYI